MGAETAAHLERLAALGCEYAQGFHLATPLTADAVRDVPATGAPPAPWSDGDRAGGGSPRPAQRTRSSSRAAGERTEARTPRRGARRCGPARSPRCRLGGVAPASLAVVDAVAVVVAAHRPRGRGRPWSSRRRRGRPWRGRSGRAVVQVGRRGRHAVARTFAKRSRSWSSISSSSAMPRSCSVARSCWSCASARSFSACCWAMRAFCSAISACRSRCVARLAMLAGDRLATTLQLALRLLAPPPWPACAA